MKKVLTSGHRVILSVRFLPIILAVAISLFISGCHFEIGNGSIVYNSFREIEIPKGFTFSTSRTVSFDLTVRQRDDAENLVPFANGVVNIVAQDDTGDRILGAGTTDASGDTEFDVLIPNAISNVVIRPERNILVEYDQYLPPTLRDVRLDLDPDSVTAKPDLSAAYLAKSVQADLAKVLPTPIPFESVSGYLLLSKYDQSTGVPKSGLFSRNPAFKQSFIDDVGATFPEYKKVPDVNPTYITVGDKSNTILTKDAEVSVTFISEGAGYRNVLGYFVYKTDSPPTSPPSKDQIVIIFPNASATGSNGGLKSGDTVALRNPVATIDGLPNAYYQTTVFNAGYSISWVIFPDGFRGSTINENQGRYYSLWSLNPETGGQFEKSHAALLLYNISPYSGLAPDTLDPIFLLGFEDLNRKTGDNDFNDALFAVESTPFSAVDIEGMPLAKKQSKDDKDGDTVLDIYDEYPEDPLRSSSVSYPSTTGYGTAMFEDLWPSIGDFDFNDLVVDFRFKTVRNAKGEAVDLISDFLLRAAGGDMTSGLAFTLPVSSSFVAGVRYSTSSANWSIVDGGRPFSREPITGVEMNGSSSITVPVFTSAHDMFGIASGADKIVNTKPGSPYMTPVPINVTVSFKTGLAASKIAVPPIDLFLVGLADDGSTRKEVHTIGFNPTALAAGTSLFNTSDDDSTGPLFYKSKKTSKSSAGAPWGLIMPMSAKYPVEKSELASSYKHFGEWVVSGGAKYPDWYNTSKSGYVDNEQLYNED